jgi:hypothetical protein
VLDARTLLKDGRRYVGIVHHLLGSKERHCQLLCPDAVDGASAWVVRTIPGHAGNPRILARTTSFTWLFRHHRRERRARDMGVSYGRPDLRAATARGPTYNLCEERLSWFSLDFFSVVDIVGV